MKLEYSTVAQCRPEDVWTVFTDATRWSEWNSMLAGMQWLSGKPWQAGSQGQIELAQPAYKLKTTMKESSPPNRIVWTGAAMGATFECAFDFVPQAENVDSTLMKAAIHLSGAAVFFISEEMKKKGMAAFAPWFEALRARAEQLAPLGGTPPEPPPA
jgi:hypothetical protein